MSIWAMDRCAHPLLDPLYWMPRRGGTPASVGALYWDWWNSDGEIGEEPPPEVLKSYELYNACKTAKSAEEIKGYSEELFDLNADQVWFIGVVGLLPHIGVVKNNFRNVPDGRGQRLRLAVPVAGQHHDRAVLYQREHKSSFYGVVGLRLRRAHRSHPCRKG